MGVTYEADTASSGIGVHRDASATALDGTRSPERLDSILRRLGPTADVEYRTRTLELALASVAQDLADEIGHRLDLTQRIQELEAALGRLRTRR